MAESVIQTSFAAGEISPNLFARVDLDKYHVGARLIRNYFVDYRGGASTRPGTRMIDRTRFSDRRARLLPFVFSQEQSYVLEFGDHYIRFFLNGQALLEPPEVITNISQAVPGVVTLPGHGYTTGDDVFIQNVLGMFEVNKQTYRIVVIDANHFSLWSLDGVALDTIGFHAYVSGGTSERVYTLTSPYGANDLRKLKFVQSADVMTLTHKLYPAMDLKRLTASTFSLIPIIIGPTLAATTAITATPTAAGNLRYGYQVVAVTAGGELGAATATPATTDSVPLDQTNVNPKNIVIDWNPVPGADHYQIFKWGPILNSATEPTAFGYIGQTTDTSFTDNNIGPDFSTSPPEFRDPFAGGNYPGSVTYFDQRRVFGGLANSPEELDFSQTGAYYNFDVSLSLKDSDAIQVALASRQVNEVKSMVATASGMVVLTTGGAFLVSGGSPQAAVTPATITALPQASTGANDLPPITVNNNILFVQSKGSIVRDLAFNFYVQTFNGFDRSALANHLFFGKELFEWAYAEEPFKLVWAVRNDGQLLSFTYVPEQEVYAWAHHDTQGLFESVCSVPEGQEDAVYVEVQRVFGNGGRARYIERFASRKFIRIEDVWCVDSGVNIILDRPAYGLDVVVTGSTAVFTATVVPPFDAGWLGQIIWFDVGGKFEVTLVTADTLEVNILQPPGNAIPNTDPVQYFRVEEGTWEIGPLVSIVVGLGHLAGQKVEVVADGMSIGPMIVPDAGKLTIPPSSKVVVGLGYQCQLQSLNLDVGDPTIQGKRKKIAAVTVFVDQSRGLKVGETFNTLRKIKEQPGGSYTPPLPLISGQERIVINGSWNVEGVVCVQQDNPFPATVLGLVPEVVIGDTQR